MGAGASVDDFAEQVYYFSGNTVKPRMVLSIDFHSRTIFCKREVPTNKFHALSHRWQKRDANTSWTVNVENEEAYNCQLTIEEAKNLDYYLTNFGKGIWLDYVCINQSSSDDKNAQVSIMGQIYLGCCTLVVGPNLAPTMPSEDYCRRAWCIQERMFGSIKFPWNFDECNSEQLQLFAEEMIWRIPVFGDALKISDDYVYTEDWRIRSLRESVHLYPHVKDKIEQLIELMRHNKDRKLRAILALQVREQIPCIHEVEDPAWPGKWSSLTFTCDSSYVKDRLYGVWGVPMYMKGIALPYDNERHAFMLIKRFYPVANFAAYSTLPDDYYRKYNWKAQDLLTIKRFQSTSIVLHSVLTGNSEAISSAPPLPNTSYFKITVHNIPVTIAVSSCSVAFGWEATENDVPSSTPLDLVIHRSLVQEYPGDRPHYAVFNFYHLLATKGCSVQWDTAYILWKELRRLIN